MTEKTLVVLGESGAGKKALIGSLIYKLSHQLFKTYMPPAPLAFLLGRIAMDYSLIIEWIDHLEPASDTGSLILPKPSAPKTARKRKAISSYSLASPPPSYTEGVNDNNMSSTSQKRRRVRSQGGLVDPDATPRPGSRSFPSSAASMSASEPSSLSRQSPAKAQIMSLRLGDAGIEYETLNDDSVPEAAKTLFTTMTEIERGFDILQQKSHSIRINGYFHINP